MHDNQRPQAVSDGKSRSVGQKAAASIAEVRSSLVGETLLVIATLVGLAVVCLSGLLITALVDDVSEADGVTKFDHRVLSWVLDHRTSAWTSIARTVTHLGDPFVVVAVTAVASISLIWARRFNLGAFVVLATSGAAIASSVAKLAIDRSRPPETVWLSKAWGLSFPSGHATQSVACWGALAIVACVLIRSRRWRTPIVVTAVAIALSVGTSRIYLGVHWFADVVCGWALASLWLATLFLAGWCTPRLRTIWTGRRISRPSVGS
ncbi:MAG: phosphatase PAP2 family protein [Microthrixaceae bacterium]